MVYDVWGAKNKTPEKNRAPKKLKRREEPPGQQTLFKMLYIDDDLNGRYQQLG